MVVVEFESGEPWRRQFWLKLSRGAKRSQFFFDKTLNLIALITANKLSNASVKMPSVEVIMAQLCFSLFSEDLLFSELFGHAMWQ